MLQALDQYVIPFLANIYGAVGYLGVLFASIIESAMIPLPSELILPFAGFLVADPSAIEKLTNSHWSYWIVVVVATIGNLIGSLISYGIGVWGGRPFLERWGRYVLIRPHDIDLADHFFERYGSATAFFTRLLPVVRTFISFVAGVARMDLRKFVIYTTLGAFLWSAVLTEAGVLLGDHWEDIRRTLQPFDLIIAVIVLIGVVAFIWWRMGTPGMSRVRNRGAD